MVLKSNILRTLNPNPSMTAEQRKLYQNPEAVRKILKDTQTIAVVGLSAKPYKASYSVANYMHAAGYRIIPVNPQVDRVLGEKSYPSLSDIPEHIDLVDIFRPPADSDVPVVRTGDYHLADQEQVIDRIEGNFNATRSPVFWSTPIK